MRNGHRKGQKRQSRTSGRSVVAVLRSHGFVHRLIRFASDILGSIQVRALRLRGRLGLEDPADTGRVWSFVGPLTAILAGLPGTDIEIDPDFESASMSLDGTGVVRIIPIEVFVAVISFRFISMLLCVLCGPYSRRGENEQSANGQANNRDWNHSRTYREGCNRQSTVSGRVFGCMGPRTLWPCSCATVAALGF